MCASLCVHTYICALVGLGLPELFTLYQYGLVVILYPVLWLEIPSDAVEYPLQGNSS